MNQWLLACNRKLMTHSYLTASVLLLPRNTCHTPPPPVEEKGAPKIGFHLIIQGMMRPAALGLQDCLEDNVASSVRNQTILDRLVETRGRLTLVEPPMKISPLRIKALAVQSKFHKCSPAWNEIITCCLANWLICDEDGVLIDRRRNVNGQLVQAEYQQGERLLVKAAATKHSRQASTDDCNVAQDAVVCHVDFIKETHFYHQL